MPILRVVGTLRERERVFINITLAFVVATTFLSQNTRTTEVNFTFFLKNKQTSIRLVESLF